jgi:DNA (cytosine-5)-methyltransferase 1
MARQTSPLTFIDLFCGIGGFHVAGSNLGWKCLMSSDIDPHAAQAYEANFGQKPLGDIHKITNDEVPDHDVLLAGFPCQPFSICGAQLGFDDTRGTLFFEIARIIKAKQPRAFVLENVKQLVTHNDGKTLARILEVTRGLGYTVDYRVLNALNFGLPQKRERILIVGTLGDIGFEFPTGGAKMKPLAKVLEPDVPKQYYASERIRRSREEKHVSSLEVGIWHENKGGNVTSHPYSCALRAGASYNYLLVNGERRLTPREMLRLQGFPDTYKIVCNYSQTRRQAGNAVPVPVVQAVMTALDEALTQVAVQSLSA